VDLVTVSDCRGILEVEEPRFDSRLFPDTTTPRCKMFSGKKVRWAPCYCAGKSVFECRADGALCGS